MGLSGICITDHEALSAHIKALKFYKAQCDKDEKWKDFKLGLGNEIYLCRNNLTADTYEKGEKFPHFILVAKDKEGHRQLRELSSRAWSHSFTMFLTRVPTYYKDIEEIVGANPGHLVASSACFLPGQKIKTRNGYKKIEDIQSGDEVRNYKGEWEPVIQPTSRLYEGQGYEIYRQGRVDPIRCTANHKFLVSNNNYIAYSTTKKSVLYWQEAKKITTISGNKRNFGVRPVNTLFTGDYQIFKNDFEHIVFPESTFSPRRLRLKQTIDITPEVMRLFGLYLGDGSIDCGVNPRINFTFNEAEFPVYYESFVKKALGDIGGNWSINQRPELHRVDLICNNRDVYELFYYIFGSNHASTKYIPERLKHISKELDEELLFGYLLADGHFRVREKEGYWYGETVTTSVSQQLTEDYIDLFNDLGMTVSVYQRKEYTGEDGVHHQKSYYTSMGSLAFGQVNKLYPYSHQEVIELFKKGYDNQAKNRVIDKNGIEYLRIRIQKIIPIRINERVYCLNNTTHSFTCENMIVHNCIGGWLGICKANGAEQNALAFIKWCKSIFGEDFYLELQPARYPEQIEYNKWLLELGKETNTKCIITTDSHYLKAEDREVHASFLNSKDGDRETAEFYQYTYVMSPEEIKELMGDYIDNNLIEGMFVNTNEINGKIESYDLAQPQIVPHLSDDRIKHPEWKVIYPKIKIRNKFEYLIKYYNSSAEDDRYLIYLGLMKLQDLNLSKEKREQYLERLETELTECWLVSERLGQPISSYLLMVRNIIQIMWNKAESLVGISRGSAGVMLINYLIGITQMNPLEQGVYLPHWRFLERNKIELPDIDVDSEGRRRPTVLRKIKEAAQSDGGDSTCVCTFGTLGTRSAILTAARGLGIDIDEAQYLATMIPQERGFLWPLKDCIKGNKDKDRKPIKSLITEFKKYPNFLETCLAIEGLVCQTGIHACGLVVFNVPVYTYNAMMKAPNGTEITQFDLGDTEYMGGLKMDCLSVEALDKIHSALDLLLEDNLIEWQSGLYETYCKYLHPDILDRTNLSMWQKVWDNEIIDIFQMDSTVGKQSLSLIKPENIPQMAAVNSLMRLVPEKGAKTPTEEYVIYKQHPELIRKEINDLHATDEEKDILYNFMKDYTGVLESQESAMLAVMLPFTNYDVPHANKIRKIIAKKKMKEIASAREEYFAVGAANGVSEDILKYIWDVQIKRQLGYSFSIPHTVAYSLIALQEMNLNLHFPPVYWATACLTVNSGGADEENGGTTNYGKLSSAIGRIKTQGITVKLPDINKARFSFTPDKETNSIIYGLKGISDVGDEVINKIITNRPYSSFQDFLEKVNPTKVQTIALIKAGCFDELEDMSRKELLYYYLDTLIPRKNKLTLANVNGLINYKVLPKNKSKFIYLFNFNKYLKLNKKDDHYLLDERAYDYYSKNFDVAYLINKGKKTYIPIKVWDSLYKDGMVELKEYLNKHQDKLIDKLHEAEIDEVWKQYCDGTISTWEMDSLGFYYHDHELAQVFHPEFEFKNYFKMSSTPIPREVKEVKGRQIPIFDLEAICGTVVDKSSYKHTIVLLTPNGVVNVKCVAEHYSKYDKQISQINAETGHKEVIERSWFKRGTKLIVCGWRNGDQFMARGRQSEGKYPFYKVLGVEDSGLLEITRYRADD